MTVGHEMRKIEREEAAEADRLRAEIKATPETCWTGLTDREKIERLQYTLGALIVFLERELGPSAASALLKALHEGVPPWEWTP